LIRPEIISRLSEEWGTGSGNLRMGNKIIWKFTAAFIALILVSVLILNFFVGLQLKDYYEQKISRDLIASAVLVGDILREDIINESRELIQQKTEELSGKVNSRITVINRQGLVIGESERNPEQMDDHKDRLEVRRAIQEGIGESKRFSDTLSYNMKYVAVSVKEDNSLIAIIRLALPLKEVESQFRIIYKVVLTGGLIAIVFVLIAGYFLSRNLISPISEIKEAAQSMAQGDFSRRLSLNSDDELGILARSLKSMADELQLRLKDMKKLDSMRSDFVANVSHELKTPLTSIKGFIETLEGGALDDRENAIRFLAIIKKHAEGLSNITDDLLKLSELESGKDRIERADFNLKNLITEVVHRYDHVLAEKSFKLEQEFNGDDFQIKADRLKVEHILVNLLDNSMKYTGEGGTIKVCLSGQTDHFEISVEDNGIGIPDEHIERIFERFYRVDKARSRKLGGTGLGLSIVKHAVLLHSGNVQVESREGKGTTVTVTLPKE
jgi:two-component system phosphate regulon sensor histidine kinase PhoR